MKNIVITGTNRGLGLALVKKYISDNNRVFALCRNASSELKATKANIIENVDISDLSSIKKAFNEIKDTKIDILINNAGGWTNSSDYSEIITNFSTNSIGSMKVVDTFLPILGKDSKIAFITSKMGSMQDNNSGGRYGYRMSKAALNAYGKSLSIDLKNLGISVGLIHPGWVKTDMCGQNALITAEVSSSNIADVIDRLSLENTGNFFNYDGQPIAW